MSREVVHSLILIVTIASAFLFAKSSISQFDLQITAALFIVYFVAKRFQKGGRLLESVIFSLIVLIIVNTTGGVASPFFFLVYFLLFSVVLFLEPVISIVVTLSLIVFFVLTLGDNQGVKTLLPIFSLAFLTPFAMFMGQEYMKNEKLKVKSEKLQTDAFLFLSLTLKNHVKNIKKAVENFMGDHQLKEIEKSSREMERLIEKFEKEG